MALVSYLPKPLKHGLTEADIVVVAHVPTVDKDCTLRALVPRTLEFVSIRVGHVIYRTRKRRVRIVRSHNVLGLCLSSLVHLLNVLQVQPNTVDFGDFVAIRVEEDDGQLSFSFAGCFEEETLFRITVIKVCPVIAFENKCAVCIYCLCIVLVSDSIIENRAANLRLRGSLVA